MHNKPPHAQELGLMLPTFAASVLQVAAPANCTHLKSVGCKVQLLKIFDGQQVIHWQPGEPASCQPSQTIRS
jgi:hypothetical protein